MRQPDPSQRVLPALWGLPVLEPFEAVLASLLLAAVAHSRRRSFDALPPSLLFLRNYRQKFGQMQRCRPWQRDQRRSLRREDRRRSKLILEEE